MTRTVDSASETYTYDSLGRLTVHASALGSFTRSYLAQTSQLTGQALSNGVGTQWVYDTNTNDRRLKSIVNSGKARSFDLTSTPEHRRWRPEPEIHGFRTFGRDPLGTSRGSWRYHLLNPEGLNLFAAGI